MRKRANQTAPRTTFRVIAVKVTAGAEPGGNKWRLPGTDGVLGSRRHSTILLITTRGEWRRLWRRHLFSNYVRRKVETPQGKRAKRASGHLLFWDGDEYFGDQQGLYKWEYHSQTDEWSWEPSGKNYDKDKGGVTNTEHYITDPMREDTDGDGLGDGPEIAGWAVDIADYLDTCGNSDEIDRVIVERPSYTAPSNPLKKDSDVDGIFDYAEYLDGTDPLNTDTDGDGLSDMEEASNYYWNPFTWDPDEQQYGRYESTSSLNPDTDFDGINDYWEAWISTDIFTDPTSVVTR